MILEAEKIRLHSKQNERQRDQRGCGNRRKYTSGKLAATEEFLEFIMCAAREYGCVMFGVFGVGSKRKEKEEKKTKEKFFPGECAAFRVLLFFAIF